MEHKQYKTVKITHTGTLHVLRESDKIFAGTEVLGSGLTRSEAYKIKSEPK